MSDKVILLLILINLCFIVNNGILKELNTEMSIDVKYKSIKTITCNMVLISTFFASYGIAVFAFIEFMSL